MDKPLQTSTKRRRRKAEQSLEPKNKKTKQSFPSKNKENNIAKEEEKGKRTRLKRATKTTRDYNSYDCGAVQRMSWEKNDSEQDGNQTLQKTGRDSDPESETVIDYDSDSESETEELEPPVDIVFRDDIYPATRHLNKADKEKLAKMHKSRQDVYTCPKHGHEVRPEDCHKLVSNDCTVDRVIGAWMSILEDKFKTKANVPTCYLGSLIFRDFVRRGMTKYLDKELEKIKGQRLICYPVCTPMCKDPKKTGNHWTLIVLDTEEGKWTHFNTLLGTGRWKDWNYHHVKELMDWLDKKMGEKYVKTMEQVSPTAKMSKATNPKRENYKDTPQQPDGSNDCGICILMILEQLMEGKTKEQIRDMFEFTEEEVAKYRTQMVQTFLRLGEKQKQQKRQHYKKM